MGSGEDHTMLAEICMAIVIGVGVVASYFLVAYTVESMTTHKGATPWQLIWEDFTVKPE